MRGTLSAVPPPSSGIFSCFSSLSSVLEIAWRKFVSAAYTRSKFGEVPNYGKSIGKVPIRMIRYRFFALEILFIMIRNGATPLYDYFEGIKGIKGLSDDDPGTQYR